MTLRGKVRQQLSDRLLPELRRRGFEGPSKIGGNGLLHEFKRRKGDVTHAFTIQFEKSGLPRFVINLHIEPAEGVQSILTRGGTIVSGRATPKPGRLTTRTWFRADQPVLRRLFGSKSREAEAVSEVLAMIEEFEDWWSNPRPTEHIVDMSAKFLGKENAA
jgi:hypothetical protein